MSHTDPKEALAAGLAVGAYRISHDDIIWRLPHEKAVGATFEGVPTERDCPHETCGWFFVAKPADVLAHRRPTEGEAQ